MQTLDLTLPSPAENLALDEALLLEAEHDRGGEVLRFWMSRTPFVVVGIGAKVEQEVRLSACEKRQIPVLRRCSGGGTVVQGPGCLNYALVLPVSKAPPLKTIKGANQWIMSKNATALSTVVGRAVSVEGHTDLAIEGLKVSGNAQRRLRTHLLFHGTFLLDFNLALISELLPTPALQPSYRQHRSHDNFLVNLGLAAEKVKTALLGEWESADQSPDMPSARIAKLVQERYNRPEWNFRR